MHSGLVSCFLRTNEKKWKIPVISLSLAQSFWKSVCRKISAILFPPTKVFVHFGLWPQWRPQEGQKLNFSQSLQKLAQMIPYNVLVQPSIVSIHPVEPIILLHRHSIHLKKIKFQTFIKNQPSVYWAMKTKWLSIILLMLFRHRPQTDEAVIKDRSRK